MSPVDEDAAPNADDYAGIDHIIVPRTRDIGGFEVRRVLPSVKKRMADFAKPPYRTARGSQSGLGS